MKWVFWTAAFLIAYTYVGYACWLWFRLLWRARPVTRGPCTPPVSIAMVVRNEEEVLESKLQNLLSLDYPACQIIVVSDGSTEPQAVAFGGSVCAGSAAPDIFAAKRPIQPGCIDSEISVLCVECAGVEAHGKAGILTRIADAAGTFVLLNGAAVVALVDFVTGRRAAWTW